MFGGGSDGVGVFSLDDSGNRGISIHYSGTEEHFSKLSDMLYKARLVTDIADTDSVPGKVIRVGLGMGAPGLTRRISPLFGALAEALFNKSVSLKDRLRDGAEVIANVIEETDKAVMADILKTKAMQAGEVVS